MVSYGGFRVMVFNTTFFQQYFSFIGGGNQMTLRKPDLQQVIDKLNNIMLP
jgi:glutamine synthetase adenylyltransferase